MKRSEMLLKLQRFYSIKHVMVEFKYITPDQFMDEVLQLVEDLGMSPPFNSELYYKTWRDGGNGREWEDE